MSSGAVQDSEQFRVVTETMVDGLIVIDSAGIIRYVNPACERLFEYDDGALLGRNVSSLMPSPFAEAHDGYLARHRDQRVKGIVGIGRELKGLKSDGTVFHMYLSVGEAVIGGETRFIGIIYDLTEKKRAEDLILHHQKLDAIGQLSGGIAHDFNNILSVIAGNLEMIAAQQQTLPAQRALVRAQEAVERAARITQRLLAFARRGSLTSEPVDLNDAFENLSDMLRRSLGETVEVAMQLEADPAIVDADIDQLETAILNLAINSKDAMPHGGRIVIETENARILEDPRMIQEVPAGDYVRVSVSDSGKGMPPEIRDRVMEPFFTTKEVGKGTGLGLAMVYGFLKQLGGHVRIYSEVGRGTRVSLFFPRSKHETADRQHQHDFSIARGGGETILLVEDDPDVRFVTVSRLQSLGYDVLTAIDGQSALEIVRTSPGISLGLLDVVMPGGMDGHELADEIEAIEPGIRLILMSGYSAKMTAGLDEPGGRPFLSKPVSLFKLARVLRKTLEGTRPV
jgi:PAS domain S-box-containing protein